MIGQINPICELAVDGGVDEVTAPMAVAAGANVLVAGSSIFGASKRVPAAVDALREAITQLAR
jgi:ribulose-phosphate 3-epimerase